jgi:hypothetical protein
MKTNGGHEIVPETSRTKTEHGDKFFQSGWAAGVIGIAGIGAAWTEPPGRAARPEAGSSVAR